jgi:hypothetical protein
MPYKSEKIKIEKTKLDRRIKLTEEQKDKIASFKGLISQRKCAEMFNVSRRTIVFIWFPEKLERNKQVRQERGGWKQYYNRNKNAEYIREHRRYKQKLFLKGEIE